MMATWPKELTYPPVPVVVTTKTNGKVVRREAFDGKRRVRLVKPTERYALVNSKDTDYALYFQPLKFGYAKAMEFNTFVNPQSGRKVAGVRWMAGNSSGLTEDGRPRSVNDPLSLNWVVEDEKFYGSMEDALRSVQGRTSVATKGRPKEIKPLTLNDLS